MVGSLGIAGIKLSKIKNKKPLRIWFTLGVVAGLLVLVTVTMMYRSSVDEIKSTPIGFPIPSSKITIARKQVAFVVPIGLVSYTNDGVYDLMLFRTQQQKESFINCVIAKLPMGECNNYSLGLKISVLDNTKDLPLEEFGSQEWKSENLLNATQFQRLKIDNYDVVWRDYEGMGLIREIYLARGSKVYFFSGNSFQDSTHSAMQNLNLLNELVKGADFTL